MSKARHGAEFVAAGILLTRLTGLVRQRVFAHYFGLGIEADAFSAAFRIPNFLQNLFGEGALSASFIPVYSSLVARDERGDAHRVAGTVASLVALVVAGVVLGGVIATPVLIDLIAPGFAGDQRTLTIRLVRILFPGTGLLVLSAWCLGVLNSHRRFLLPYAAPIMWNGAMIATLVIFGGQSALPRLAVILAWGSVVGSALQFGVQVPAVLRVAPGLRPALALASTEVRTVVRNFVPVLVSRGVVQISAYVDTLLASLLPTGAVAGLMNAQLLYTLPISLFGLSVSAAELPTMSAATSAAGVDAAGAELVRARVNAGLRHIAFLVIPSAVAFLALGDVIAAALLQTGRFGPAEAVYVWGILAGAALGLLPSTLGRLYSSAYYAVRDTRTPLRFATLRVALGIVMGYFFAIVLPPALDIPRVWGAAGLTIAAGLAGWVEMLLLRRFLDPTIGATGLGSAYLVKLWTAATGASAAAWIVKLALPTVHPALVAVAVLGVYGSVFLVATRALGLPDAGEAFARIVGRRRNNSQLTTHN